MFQLSWKDLRTLAGKTRREAAAAAGVTPRTIGRWETYATHPDINQISALAKLYELESYDIIALTDPAKR